MKFQAEQFCIDYNIPYWDQGKNVGHGWLNIQCPMCDDSSNHGGFHIEKGYYNCWKCGGHSLPQIIRILTNTTYAETKEIIEKYSLYSIEKAPIRKKLNRQKQLNLDNFLNISGVPTVSHINYLVKRDFNFEHIKKKYGIKFTCHLGDYKYRIIIPIFYKGKIVSFQSRDITEKQIRYKACAKKYEVVHHKDILYNLNNATEDWVVIVEGITDVWRLGDNSIATFGSSVTPNQILEIQDLYKKVFIMFDNEPEAQKKADKLYQTLQNIGVKCLIICLEQGDPGDMKQKKANSIMKSLEEYAKHF